jgi:hypothetical protein
MANDSAEGMVITLQVGGMLVSGTLASGSEYFDAIAKEFASFGTTTDSMASIRSEFAAFGDMYKPESDNPDEFLYPQFLHLKEAQLLNTSGGPIPKNDPVLWRGRITEVSAFLWEP